jgi:hypothetical protein
MKAAFIATACQLCFKTRLKEYIRKLEEIELDCLVKHRDNFTFIFILLGISACRANLG